MIINTHAESRDSDLDLEYFREKLARMEDGRSFQAMRARAQIALLEDAIKIYRLVSPPREDKYQHNIPASLLVQTFMRKLQNDLDRR